MVTSTREMRLALDGLHVLLERDIKSFWKRMNLTDPAAVRNAFLAYTPQLVQSYGDSAAVLAADWYDELRAAEGLSARFAAQLADGVPAAWVEERVRFGAGSLWTGTPEQFRAFVTDISRGYVTQSFGDTIDGAVKADPQAVGWARFTNAGACDFCVMLAGRGDVYMEETARFASHAGCKCGAKPSWDRNAKEVPALAYVASERASVLTPEQRAIRAQRVRDWIKNNK